MKLTLPLLTLVSCLSVTILEAQENVTYQTPPKEIMQLVEYDRSPSVNIDSRYEYILLSYRPTYKSLIDLNQEEIRLAGLRINPKHFISSTVNYVYKLAIQKIGSNHVMNISGIPSDARIANITWSPNEEKIAFTNTTEHGLELWVADIKSASAKKLSNLYLNANLGNPIKWMKDSQSLLVNTRVDQNSKLINPATDIPKGPIVSISDGSVSANRTYQDLLKNKSDEHNFEIIASSAIYKVNLTGESSLFKDAALYSDIAISPNGEYVMITTIERPYSYIVPLSRFPSQTIIYNNKGVKISTVNTVPSSEILPKGFMAVRKGKRSMQWRADKPATIVYTEALDNGDPAEKVDYRDAIYTLDAPFTANPTLLTKTIQRYGGIIWGNDTLAIMYDNWYDTRNMKTYRINPSQPTKAPVVIFDRNYQDIYSDPGSFETRKNAYGNHVIAIENSELFLTGEGHSTKGQFPFIDKLNINTLQTKRWYQSTYTNKKLDIVTITDFKKGTALVRLESATDYPNYYFINNFGKKATTHQITNFTNPFESIKNVHKEVIKYTRKDGVSLSGTLYLPADYDKKSGKKLPLLIWAYPAEYKDKNSAGQSSHNPNEFTFPYYGSFVYWVTRGYAVLDDAAFPIIGEGSTEPNDNFIEQLVMNGEAAIDAVDKLGYIDRNRVGVGGHSYGAFMTANLLTHSNLFACGIARSGAYNRTLTPFGFQSEQRTYWDVPSVYNTMSPFMNADKMKKPMLLVHGEADNNPGTFTLQTERYFQALKGMGAPVRMVILPKESHSYVAKENIMHLLWEQDQFLEKHLKNKD